MDILSILQRLGSGRLLDDLHDALITTADEVVTTGKPGTVTIKLTVSNQEQGDPMVIIAETVSRVSPKKDPKGAFFWAVDGSLHKDDPRQVRMEFRKIDTETGEVRDLKYPEREERTVE